ncbi:MAG: anaerobic ribonucleoside-triphosphate reductase activating protein [Lachnospiraceae bacterium]|nr:anaerobic ribonucleoside-triphosphate reductase activating protein [Lachnospiraceae bacterium]HAK17263.1 anaerobic ribonucleoside-triphosphate reductase activating protein [Lachnospiraceae bacterium]
MNYAQIKYCDIANGTGVRTSLFVSGCTHHCKGCFNEIAWDFGYGEPFTDEVQQKIIDSLAPEYIAGLSLLGGEPMEPVNQRALVPFLRKVRAAYPDKTLWCYTGYTYETDLLDPEGRAHCEVTDEFLSYIDMLVDGKFVEELKDITLLFRGSSNQRLLHLSSRDA